MFVYQRRRKVLYKYKAEGGEGDALDVEFVCQRVDANEGLVFWV